MVGVLMEAGDDSRVHTRNFNIVPMHTLPHPLDCLICVKDMMVSVATANDGQIGRLGGGSFVLRFGW